MNNIPLIDILALAVVLACIFLSMMRGVITEVTSLLTWIVAFLIAKWFAVSFAEIAFRSIEPQALAVAMSFVLLFLAAWLVQRLMRSLLTAMVSAVGLGGINRFLGGVFGAIKGILVVTLVVMVCSFTDLPETKDWKESYSVPYFETLAQLMMPYLSGGGTEPKIIKKVEIEM